MITIGYRKNAKNTTKKLERGYKDTKQEAKSRSDLTPKTNNMNYKELADICTETLNKLAKEDQKKQNEKWHKEIKKANRKVEQEPIKTRTQTWSLDAITEVNGKPALATIREARISEDGLERSITEITIGKTTKRRYDINHWTLDDRIAETAEEEEDRINGEA